MIEASARNVQSGFANATMPAMTKITPRKPWSHFQPPCTAPMERNSSMPAAIAMTPKRIEIAYTVVSSMRKTMRLMISQRIPAIRKIHQALDSIRAVSAES